MKQLLAVLTAALLLAACGPPVAQVPTATPAPTATPTPAPTLTPTATPTPTATATPTAAQAAGGPIAAALAKTAAADSYTIDLVVEGTGAVLGAQVGAGPGDLASLQGTFAGDDFEYTLTGLTAGLLAGDPAAGLRAMRADGVSYVRGPLPLLGAVEDAWYRLAPEQALLVAPPISADSTAGALARSNPDFSDFAQGGSELVGGQQCRRYTGGRDATLGLLQSLAQSGLPVDADSARIDQASSAVLVCADGYLHALDLAFSGTSATEQPAPYSYDLRLRLSGFDQQTTIEPPQGARPLPTPTR